MNNYNGLIIIEIWKYVIYTFQEQNLPNVVNILVLISFLNEFEE